MKILFVFLPSVWLFFFAVESKSNDTYCPQKSILINSSPFLASVIGTAFKPDRSRFLYCEYYYLVNSNETTVNYHDRSGQLVAQKILRFFDNKLQPEVVQKDFRNGELRQVLFTQNEFQEQVSEEVGYKNEREIEVSYTKANSQSLKVSKLRVPANLVIDAGFDEAVRKNWPNLIEGKKIGLPFLSKTHFKAFNLSMSSTKNENCYFDNKEIENTMCLKIRPSSSFLNFFAKPLFLIYDTTKKRLINFNGVVNITTVEGKTQQATIDYFYVN